jgi:hypothetical protein
MTTAITYKLWVILYLEPTKCDTRLSCVSYAFFVTKRQMHNYHSKIQIPRILIEKLIYMYYTI